MRKIKTRQELIKAYVDFYKNKKHHQLPSSSLIPENDPTALFISAGMQPLAPYLMGMKHPHGKRLVNIQKCVRTGDIDEVGDEVHHTFFEMSGNWSLGDYWKKDAIKYSFEFLTDILGFEKEKLGVTVFGGDKKIKGIGKDEESVQVWKELGFSSDRISYLGAKDNIWGPIGEYGPCGPSTEIFYWTGKGMAPKKLDVEDEGWVEVGNDVLMGYEKLKNGEFKELKQKNVDFGGGIERTLAVLNGKSDDYSTSIFKPEIIEIEKLTGKKYKGKDKKLFRVIADHVRAAVFILGDEKGISPSNIGQGYVLRRLIRRAIRYGKILGIKVNFLVHVAKSVLPIYPDYQELGRNKKFIFSELEKEEEKFGKTLEMGLKKFNEIVKDDLISGKEAFLLFQSYGFPIEMTVELANEKGAKVDLEEYNDEFKRHQDLSRTASSGQFKSGLADESSTSRRLHTATHLLNEALRLVLGEGVKQRGSNITPERLRFDFSFDRKMTAEEIKKVEELVNSKIKAGLEVLRDEVPLKDAIKGGAQAEFGAKYPELVSVYTIVDPSEKNGWFSKEICTGPHVSNTREVGVFRIVKESSSAAGVRRIKGIVE
jgi:alanyl-tRNA synthetase